MGKLSLQMIYWLVSAGLLAGAIAAANDFGRFGEGMGYPLQGLAAGLCVLSATFAFLADRARRDGQPPRAP